MKYRFYLMSGPSRVSRVTMGEFVDDYDARAAADALLHQKGSAAVEVWTAWKLVAHLERATVPA